MNVYNIPLLAELNRSRKHLTKQQYKTIRGQILAGNVVGAKKGLDRLLKRKERTN